jgi:hypothetical protein
LVLVAGTQPAQVGVHPVDDGGALGDELLAVVHEHPQIRRQTLHRPHRRQVLLPGSDPGDGDRIDRVVFALTRPGQPFPGGQQRWHFDHGHADLEQVHGCGPAEIRRSLDPQPLDVVLDGESGQRGEATRVVGDLPDHDRPPAGVDHRDGEGVLVTVDSCEHVRPSTDR